MSPEVTEKKRALNKVKSLLDDAKSRGMFDLAVVYGWWAIRLGDEMIAAQIAELSAASQELLLRGQN